MIRKFLRFEFDLKKLKALIDIGGGAGASGVGVGSAVNRLDDELAMVAVVRGLREALTGSVPARV